MFRFFVFLPEKAKGGSVHCQAGRVRLFASIAFGLGSFWFQPPGHPKFPYKWVRATQNDGIGASVTALRW